MPTVAVAVVAAQTGKAIMASSPSYAVAIMASSASYAVAIVSSAVTSKASESA